jgi:hypothetical protein
MKLFDLFKSRNEGSPAKEHLDRAQELYDNGKYAEALRALTWGFIKDVDYMPLYKLAVASLAKLEAEDERQLFDAVLNHPGEFKSYNDMGNHFSNARHYTLAQPFLGRAHELNERNVDTAHELAIAYARTFQIGRAVDVLTSVNYRRDLWATYFMYRCRILDGSLDGLDESIQEAIDHLQTLEASEEAEIAKLKFNELKEMLVRYSSVEDPRTHIRDWHYIQYGGMILDYFDDMDDYVAGGRYVAAWGSNESIKTIAHALKLTLNELSIAVTNVMALDHRDSEIVGRVIASELNAGFSLYSTNQPGMPGLVVVSDSRYLNDHPYLETIRPGQMIFALNHCWLDTANISPDIIGLMSQAYYLPWDKGIRFAGEGEIDADNRSAEEIASDISRSEVQSQGADDLLSFYREHRPYLKGIGEQSGSNRHNFTIESPVAGSFFG